MSLFEKMLVELPFNREELKILILTAPQRYKVHFIEKRNGKGKREIAQPTAEVKLLQRWLVSAVISELPIHNAATAYRLGGSIQKHARPHAAQKYLLKLDFENFFPSITASALEKHLRQYKHNLPESDIDLLKAVLFKGNRRNGPLTLAIGAPSSPALSNSLLYNFDEAVQRECDGLKVKYTRYADDLAFSTNVPHILAPLHARIIEICKEIQYPTLSLNEKKTINLSRKHHRELTGVVLTNGGKISIGHDNRRLIRAMVDYFARGQLSPQDVAKLRGLIAFSRSIDPTVVSLVTRRLQADQIADLVPGFIQTPD